MALPTPSTPGSSLAADVAPMVASMDRLDARAAAAAAAARVALLTARRAEAKALTALGREARLDRQALTAAASALTADEPTLSPAQTRNRYVTLLLIAFVAVAVLTVGGVAIALHWLRMPWSAQAGPQVAASDPVPPTPTKPTPDLSSVFLHGVSLAAPTTVTQGINGAAAPFIVTVHTSWGGTLPPSARLTVIANAGTEDQVAREVLLVGTTSQSLQYDASALPVGQTTWTVDAEWKGRAYTGSAVTTVVAAAS